LFPGSIGMSEATKIHVQVRGEVGEVIHSWCLMRHFMAVRAKEYTGDLEKDMENQNLWFLSALVDKLESEIVSRLSELAKPIRRGRINFENLTSQLQRGGVNSCEKYVRAFRSHLKANRFDQKRNNEISHKAFVLDWADEKPPIHISYPALLRGLALAVRTMKAFDRAVYGSIHFRFMWLELRKRRYKAALPPRAGYMIAEHIHVPVSVRAEIIKHEIQTGRFHQDLMDAEINGIRTQLYASKKWGAINLGGHLMIVEAYPLQSIQTIEGANIVVEPAPKNEVPLANGESPDH
jgi:hypothetical protein